MNNCTTALTYATASNTFGCASGVVAHAMLSASHSDTLAASVARGDLLVGSSVPQWTRLPLGAANGVLTTNGTDATWSTTPTLNGLTLNIAGIGTSFSQGGAGGSTIQLAVDRVMTSGSFGASGSGILYDASLTEYSSGTHNFLYGHNFSSSWTNGGATTTVGAVVHIGTISGSTATTTYSLDTDGLVNFDLGIRERGRATSLGEWVVVTFSGGNFTASGSLTWTVESGDIYANAYTEIGTTQIWSLGVVTTSTGGTASTELRATLPNSRTATGTTNGACSAIDNSTEVLATWAVVAGNSYAAVTRTSGANWSNASTNATLVRCTITSII
jgi:hypothetical protein